MNNIKAKKKRSHKKFLRKIECYNFVYNFFRKKKSIIMPKKHVRHLLKEILIFGYNFAKKSITNLKVTILVTNFCENESKF